VCSVPEAVLHEAGAQRLQPEDYLTMHGIADLAEVVTGIDVAPVLALSGTRRLHRGELEALALALARGLPVLLEDADARRVAKAAGLTFIGMGGLVLAAARKRVIDPGEGRRLLDALWAANRLAQRVHDALMAEMPSASEPAPAYRET
jgi:predicted nucleic acid-binding protein